MTRRRSAYRSLTSLQRDNRVCRVCVEAGHPLFSLPVLQGHEGQKAYMLGQAPGVVEGEERRPWRGRAGRTLRSWLELAEEEFYETFYCASITRCYPGKAVRGDRKPTRQEQDLCAFWRDWELRLLRPRLIVVVGVLAVERLLGPKSLRQCVGCRFTYGDAVAIPLPHPSGASGWPNAPANRRKLDEAISLIHAELDALVGRQTMDR